MCDVLASLIFSKQGRPLSQHSNGEDGQQSATAKSVVGAKVSQLAHLFQSRSKEAEAAIPIATTTTTISPSAAAVPPVSPTSSVPAPPTAAVVGGRTKPSSRSETDKETAAHQDVNNRTRRNYVVNDWWKNNVIFYYFTFCLVPGSDAGPNCRADGEPVGPVQHGQSFVRKAGL